MYQSQHDIIARVYFTKHGFHSGRNGMLMYITQKHIHNTLQKMTDIITRHIVNRKYKQMENVRQLKPLQIIKLCLKVTSQSYNVNIMRQL